MVKITRREYDNLGKTSLRNMLKRTKHNYYLTEGEYGAGHEVGCFDKVSRFRSRQQPRKRSFGQTANVVTYRNAFGFA